LGIGGVACSKPDQGWIVLCLIRDALFSKAVGAAYYKDDFTVKGGNVPSGIEGEWISSKNSLGQFQYA
jgi:hypothetical protein